MVSAGCRVEKSENESRASPLTPPSAAEPSRPEDEDAPHGRDCLGNPKTWTGRVVSLDEWRRLSEWDRHGSTNKVFNGLTWQWEPADGGADEA